MYGIRLTFHTDNEKIKGIVGLLYVRNNKIKIQMKQLNVKVTTTSGFDGVQIEEYLEPITTHIVIGMNFFKDVLSGFSDFFGGKSRIYQDTLSSMNEEVINELRRKADSIGGNCVIGLKIDNDEISAQGKSMMMVTALGTVARANFSQKGNNTERIVNFNSISSDYINILSRKKQYIKKSEKNIIKFNNSFWEFVKKNKVSELSEYIVAKYINLIDKMPDYNYNIEILNEFGNHVSEFFFVLDNTIAKYTIYTKLKEDLSFIASRRLIKIIEELKLVDYSEIISLLKHSDFSIQKLGVTLALIEKQSYKKMDIKLINEIIDLIKSTFQERGKNTKKKIMLSSKEKEIWICECGKENDSRIKYCNKCNKDIFGFNKDEVGPDVVIEKLTNVSEILNEVFE